jgi:hypothetical protein
VLNLASSINLSPSGNHIAYVHFSSPDSRTGILFDLMSANTYAQVMNIIGNTNFPSLLGLSDVNLCVRQRVM